MRVGSASLSGSLSVLIDIAFSKFRQGLIRLLFFSERAFQQPNGLIEAEFCCPRLQRTVAGDFIVLDRLGCREKTNVQGGRPLNSFITS